MGHVENPEKSGISDISDMYEMPQISDISEMSEMSDMSEMSGISDIFRFEAGEEEEGVRLDVFLSVHLAGNEVSRSRAARLIGEGAVLLNGRKKIKSSMKLKAGDEVTVYMPSRKSPEIEAEDIELDILYEDEDVIVVNKPKGMVVHPAAGHESGTLVNALLFHCHDLSGVNGVLRPGIVHRIDRDTTGSIIACKNDFAHHSIARQLLEHSIRREYRGIVIGGMEEEGTVDAPIGRSPRDRKKMAVTGAGTGKHAVTRWSLIERFEGCSYLKFSLLTGRTHQIRVHMSYIGHPILGDEVYGGRSGHFKTEGQTLHAMTLGFIHPRTGRYVEVNAPLPDYFNRILSDLRNRQR